MNNPTQPLHGLLLLRSGNGDDDTITAEEIFETTVGSDLVVLSACYSGLADQSPLPGDDLFGIQRALLHGGARTIIAGSWDVYDSTGPMIVDDLLKRLAAGESGTAALAGAQRDFLKQQRAEGAGNPWSHPYFWAVYTLTGDGRVHCVTNNGGFTDKSIPVDAAKLAGASRQFGGAVRGMDTVSALLADGWVPVPGGSGDTYHRRKADGSMEMVCVAMRIDPMGDVAPNYYYYSSQLKARFVVVPSGGKLVSQLDPNSPLSRAGIKVGDIITHFDKIPVHSNWQLENLRDKTLVGGIDFRTGNTFTKIICISAIPANQKRLTRRRAI
jgi:hypothetical protein